MDAKSSQVAAVTFQTRTVQSTPPESSTHAEDDDDDDDDDGGAGDDDDDRTADDEEPELEPKPPAGVPASTNAVTAPS